MNLLFVFYWFTIENDIQRQEINWEMVFESIVADLLNKYLGKYVENLDASQLKIGIWGGNSLFFYMLGNWKEWLGHLLPLVVSNNETKMKFLRINSEIKVNFSSYLEEGVYTMNGLGFRNNTVKF